MEPLHVDVQILQHLTSQFGIFNFRLLQDKMILHLVRLIRAVEHLILFIVHSSVNVLFNQITAGNIVFIRFGNVDFVFFN